MSPRHKFKGRLLEVSTKRVRLPNGFIAHVDVVRHIGAVLIVPFVSRDRIAMIRQYRPVIGEYLFELPAGTLGKGEALAACARRELIEETGYSAGRLNRLGAIVPVPGYSTEKIEIYRAEKLTAVGRRAEEDEVIQVMPMSRQGLRRLFRQGKLKDAKTICGLAMAGVL
jgi:ADP-ribose pyrophosphatase